jgi:hypothetical protein
MIDQESTVAKAHRANRRTFCSLSQLREVMGVLGQTAASEQYRGSGQRHPQLGSAAESGVKRDFLSDVDVDWPER